MDQQELERRLAQLASGGDTSKLKHSPTVSRKRVKNPLAAVNGGSDAEAVVEIDVVVQGWEDPTTGARVEAYQMPDGSYVIEKDTPGTKAAAASDTAPPGGKAYIDEPGPMGRRLGWNP